MDTDLCPQEFLGLGQGQVGADDVETLNDLVTGNLEKTNQS